MNRMRCFAICTLMLGFITLGISGCSRRTDEPKHTFSWQRQATADEVRRIVVLPVARNGEPGRSSSGADEAIASALRDLAQHVVIAGDASDDRNSLSDAVLTDTVRPEDLLALRDRYHADAVLVGHLHTFKGYDPVSVGMTFHLISCHDGSALWSASGNFDGSREDVQRDLASWYRHRVADSGNTVQTWRTVLHTPSLYTRYVADRMLSTLKSNPTSG